MYPEIGDHLRYNHDSILHRERTRIINFDSYYEDIYDSINGDYSHLRGSEQYEMVWEVSEQIGEKIKAITTAAKGETSFGTERSALETIKKIGETICESGDHDTLAHELRKELGRSSDLEDAMLEVLAHMSDEEKQQMMECRDGSGKQYLEQLLEFKKLADGCYCVFEDLKDVIAVLKNEHSTDSSTKTESEGPCS
jgi:hypothetical protein